MPNTLGWRRVFGVATPSVKTVVQVEYDELRPVGVVNHCEGIMMPDLTLKDAAEPDEAIRTIDEALEDAIARIATCRPDHMVLGVSGESIWRGGVKAAQRVEARIKAAMGGIPVTQATDAIPAALEALGVDGNIGVRQAAHGFPTYSSRGAGRQPVPHAAPEESATRQASDGSAMWTSSWPSEVCSVSTSARDMPAKTSRSVS